MSSKVDFTTFDRHDPRAVAEFLGDRACVRDRGSQRRSRRGLADRPERRLGPSLGFMRERLVAAGASVLEARWDRMRATSTRTCGP